MDFVVFFPGLVANYLGEGEAFQHRKSHNLINLLLLQKKKKRVLSKFYNFPLLGSEAQTGLGFIYLF